MDDLRQGRFEWVVERGRKAPRVFFAGRKGVENPHPVDLEQVEASLMAVDNPVDVDFELVQGKPMRVRRHGEQWVADPAVAGRPGPPPGPRPKPSSSALGGPPPAPRRAKPPAGPARPVRSPDTRGDFHNPYNFIPTVDRSLVKGELGDRAPHGHHRLSADLWTGRIGVRLTVETPVLILDAARAKEREDGHRVYPVRMVAGTPYLAPTAVKGALRSAYEAITNSRFGVFGGKARLGLRFPMNEAARLVPTEVVNVNGQLMARLLPGTSTVKEGGPEGPLYAAWLPSRFLGAVKHGESYACCLEELPHYRGFDYWRVVDTPRPAADAACPHPERHRVETGTVFITNENVARQKDGSGKHYERLFFVSKGYERQPLPLSLEVRQGWHELMADAQEANRRRMEKRRKEKTPEERYVEDPSGHKGDDPALSPHLYQEARRTLAAGLLCYSRVEEDHVPGGLRITDLLPVQVSRGVHALSPAQLVPEAERLLPASAIGQLSPADRVFGWVGVGQKGPEASAAYQGQLRVGPVSAPEFDRKRDLEEFAPPLSLAILSSPKPQQARFYVGDRDGRSVRAQEPGRDVRQAGYAPPRRLRGRKVYPHHQLDESEYEREAQDDQNRSIGGWVHPGTKFEVDLMVRNLSDVELGALLWLLRPEAGYLRLGAGKPLGFGSLRAETTDIRLLRGSGWAEHYRGLGGAGAAEGAEDPSGCVDLFEQTLREQYPQEWRRLLDCYRRAASGYGDNLPVRYPRWVADPAGGKSFQWFVANETGRRPRPPHGQARRLPLPDLETDRGLPQDPAV